MKRLLDANIAFAGHEPKFSNQLTEIQLLQALNWYSQNKDNKTAYKYACDYLKKKYKIDASDVVKEYSTTFGWICRILSNGGSLLPKNQKTFDNMIQSVRSSIKNTAVVVEEKKTTFSIQDRLNEKINEVAGELAGSIDDYIESKYKTDRKSTRLNSSHIPLSRMPSSA